MKTDKKKCVLTLIHQIFQVFELRGEPGEANRYF